jgi:hypothetical protein
MAVTLKIGVERHEMITEWKRPLRTAPSDTTETLCTELRRVHRAVLSTDSWAAGQSKHYNIANATAHIHDMIDASRC